MFNKIGHTDFSVVKTISTQDFEKNLASPDVLEKLNKFASTIRSIAPKSDDFLYFTIIFMKAAESALIDEDGNLKKIGKENAWGYFDKNWRWFGNVKPHKNSNLDLFPESELKLAYRNWIGKPLCVDHKSDTVDGVRGIILDTHYDEKLKQVVGLCALDKVNYPDLARKVSTGVVRFGSMGTAVSTAICFDCGKAAANANEYCDCILHKRSYGEINIGLKPIEYSLVVQPAEPGAILLRCLASVDNHKQEISSYGYSVDSLSDFSIPSLDLLLNKVCSGDSCNLEQRKGIISAYFNYNGLSKTASTKKAYNKDLIADLARFEDVFGVKYVDDPALYRSFFGNALEAIPATITNKGETFTSEQTAYNSQTPIAKDNNDMTDYTGTGSAGLVSSVTEPTLDTFKTDGDIISQNSPSPVYASLNLSLTSGANSMNENKLRERAALRRRIAFHQGGSEGVEPPTYKNEAKLSEKIRDTEDKHMQQTKSMGGADGVFPGDKEVKEKLSRAEEVISSKKAHVQGASNPEAEPKTYKSEDYKKYWELDKHMHQTKSMGGTDGVFPGDEKVKEHLKRAKYNGPKLSTKIHLKKALDGSIHKEKTGFEVYAGGQLVIGATAKDIFGSKVNENWNNFISENYSKQVVAHIRDNGIPYTASRLLVNAQAAPVEPSVPETPAPPMPAPAPVSEVPAPELPPIEEEMTSEEVLPAEGDPAQVVEEALITMEDSIEKIKESITDLAGSGAKDVDVNVNVGGEGEVSLPEDKLALSKLTIQQLKNIYADASNSADELARIAELLTKKHSKSASAQLKIITQEALHDAATVRGEASALISMAKVISKTLVKTSEFKEESKVVKTAQPTKTIVKKNPAKVPAKTASKIDLNDELVKGALDIRKARRQDLLKKAQAVEVKKETKEVEDKKVEDKKVEDKKENMASDGVGMMENAPMAGVTTTSGEDVATKAPTGKVEMPSKGGPDVNFPKSLPTTPGHEVATSKVSAKLDSVFSQKKAEDEQNNYKLKLRRAYNMGMQLQSKGLIPQTRAALEREVDNIMSYDDAAFESMNRTIANMKAPVKVASDVAIEVGLNQDEEISKTASVKSDLKSVLDSAWKMK